MGSHNSNEPPLKGISFLTAGNKGSSPEVYLLPYSLGRFLKLFLLQYLSYQVETASLSSILITVRYLVKFALKGFFPIVRCYLSVMLRGP